MVKKKTIFSEKFVSDNTPSTLQRPAHFSLKFCIYKSLIIDQIEHALAYNNEQLYLAPQFFLCNMDARITDFICHLYLQCLLIVLIEHALAHNNELLYLAP